MQHGVRDGPAGIERLHKKQKEMKNLMPKVLKKICPAGLANNPNRDLTAIHYITIHTTGNTAPTATAKMHADYQYNGSGGREASWHYTVDQLEIWQSFEDHQACWHASDGNGSGNMASIGIEICNNSKEGFVQACDNAAWLVAQLLHKHNLPIDRVKQHFDWSGKNCPYELRMGSWGIDWKGFMAKVQGYMANEKVDTPSVPTVPEWQQAAFQKLVQNGTIKSPEYWASRLNQQATIGEMFAVMASL